MKRGLGQQHTRRVNLGFTLLEIMVAMAILAFALAVISSSASSSAVFGKRVYRSTAASLLLRGVLLDIEEEYRKDGFPTNDVTDRDCELPKAYAKKFKCSFDLVGLQLDDSMIQDMTAMSQEMLTTAQEELQNSGALDKLEMSRKGAAAKRGEDALTDLGDAAGAASKTGLDLSQISKGGDMMTLISTILMSGEKGLHLLQLCDINISVLQMSMGLMVAELLPRILKRATDRTRKVRIRLSWEDDGEEEVLEMETFTTAVSEKEARALRAMKQAEELQQALTAGQGGTPNPMPRLKPAGR
jgi:prepilin-type N-terminal cleavage/methylation domain-containing protein